MPAYTDRPLELPWNVATWSPQ